MDWVKWPITFNLSATHVNVDSIEFNYMQIAELLSQLIHPDPRKWYRFERVDNRILIHVRMTEDEPNGTQVGTTGTPTASPRPQDPGGTGTQTPYA